MGVRPENCDPSIGDPSAKAPEKCPYCGQFHLRLGYCQALDPTNAAQFPQWHQKGLSVTEPEISVTSVTDSDSVTDNSLAVCSECEQPFEARRSDAKFCSAACRVRAARKRAE